ncbi:hypothetical protein [Microbacterium sp.]|uniref:hypothetical protein n=1 Tax=Microbacterium sp. TaxID=51671 RepID=UPI002D791C69|nr:hypothetical protein [Microbacterium sp.]HET6302084.1 hypothetical protein [Microbacterium sp.]
MTRRLPFEELVGAVRRADGHLNLQPRSEAAEHIAVPTVGVKHFVAPDILVEEHSLDADADVLLIAAPAAVGKSSIAIELGLRTESMVWDLSHFSLGSSFFSGTLVDAFGSGGLDLVRDHLLTGRLTLILDAADEALVRSGASNFEAAITNLIALIGESRADGPSAIVLGRPDTIEETFATFREKGVRAQIAQVAFFSEDQARSFVRAKAHRDGGGGVAEAELNRFLTDFFKVVSAAVGSGDWQSSESFLGYAPVLDALGAFYREQDNPLRRLSEIQQGPSSEHVWDLLLDVIGSILDREAEKFGGAFGGSDARKVAFGQAAYSRSAQLALLLSDDPDVIEISPPDFPDAEDAWVFEELTPQVRAWYREHPFLRGQDDEPNPLLRFGSPAFRDYAVAASICEWRDGDSARMLDFWLDARVTPSPIFSRFCMSSRLSLDQVATDVVTMVVDSHASGFLESSRLEIDVHAGDDDSGSVIEIALFEGDKEQRRVIAPVAEAEALSLARGVARTTIEAPNATVLIGSGSQDFVIGPAVSIRCAQLNAESAEVRVRATDTSANEIRTDRLVGSARRVSGAGPEALRIVVPVAMFPWQAYKVEASTSGEIEESDLYWAGMDLRRNVKWFVRDSIVGGGMNYPVAAMETILSKGRASVDVHNFCVERGYLVRRGSSWHLQLPNVSGSVVIKNDLSDASYRSLVADLFEWLWE